MNLLYIFCIYICYSYTLVNVAIPFTLLLPFGTTFLESMSSSLLQQHGEDNSKTEPVISQHEQHLLSSYNTPLLRV